MNIFRKTAVAALLLGASLAFAQSYPNKPIRIVVGGAAAGLADNVLRVNADALSAKLGVPLVIDNQPGAGGVVASGLVARSAPDGYTLRWGGSGGLELIPSAVKLPYDPEKALLPVVKVAGVYLAFAVSPKHVPAKNMAELVALAKKSPGQMSFSSNGIGTTLHMNIELLKARAGIDVIHVPYKVNSLAIQDILTGRIHAMSLAGSVVQSHLHSGNLALLAVTGPQRDPLFPNVPTMIESGYPGFVVGDFYGIFGPAGLPKEIVQRLGADFAAVASTDAFAAQIAKMGVTRHILQSDDFTREIAAERKLWHTLVRERNIKIE